MDFIQVSINLLTLYDGFDQRNMRMIANNFSIAEFVYLICSWIQNIDNSYWIP